MANELTGLTVLNTRPAAQAGGLTALLEAAGATVWPLPLIFVRPQPLPLLQRQYLLDLDRYDYVFFVSQNAVRLGLEAVADFWPQWPHRLPAIAVGQATATGLREAGLTVLVPKREDSEGVLALPELAEPVGLKVLVFRGEGGRELLVETLVERGARVDVLELYRRDCPPEAAMEFAALPRRPDVVLLSSPDVWRHWQGVAGGAALAPWLLTVSPRLAETVRAAGGRVIEAASARAEAIRESLIRWRIAGQHDID